MVCTSGNIALKAQLTTRRLHDEWRWHTHAIFTWQIARSSRISSECAPIPTTIKSPTLRKRLSFFQSTMRGKTYCCDASRRLYEDNYANQSVSGMPVFVGRRYQRRHGLGQSKAGLLKRIVVPFVAPHAKRIGKQILSNVAKTGLEVVGDVAAGKSAKESIKERALSGIKKNSRRYRASVAEYPSNVVTTT